MTQKDSYISGKMSGKGIGPTAEGVMNAMAEAARKAQAADDFQTTYGRLWRLNRSWRNFVKISLRIIRVKTTQTKENSD